MWAQVDGGAVVAVSRATVSPGPSWLPVLVEDRPPDTLASTWEQAPRVADGLPVLGWLERPWTAEELAAMPPLRLLELRAQANAETLRAQAASALATNSAYLALGSPTQAQAVAQVRMLTLEVSALIRLALGLLDSIN